MADPHHHTRGYCTLYAPLQLYATAATACTCRTPTATIDHCHRTSAQSVCTAHHPRSLRIRRVRHTRHRRGSTHVIASFSIIYHLRLPLARVLVSHELL